MKDKLGIFLIGLFIFIFFVIGFPELANNVYASSLTGAQKLFLTAMMPTLAAIFVYALYEVFYKK